MNIIYRLSNGECEVMCLTQWSFIYLLKLYMASYNYLKNTKNELQSLRLSNILSPNQTSIKQKFDSSNCAEEHNLMFLVVDSLDYFMDLTIPM